MPLHFIDYMLILVPLIAVLYIGWKAQSYIRCVADFLSAGRCAGRYLLSVCDGVAAIGLISVVANFEMLYKSGTALSFWYGIGTLVTLMMTLTGFVVYRYRETRAMTLAQFFEMRYSRSFRVFAGLVAFIAGVLNYALFPAVSGRFFMYYCNWPDYITIGGVQLSVFGLLMAFFLGLALLIVLMGGQLSTMVTDCVQGLFSYGAYAILIATVLLTFSFSQFRDVMLTRPPGESFINPFDIGLLTEFNILYVLIGVFTSVYGRMAWQGNQGYNSSGASPHEQKMGGVLGAWRASIQLLIVPLLVYGAYVYLNHPDFAAQAAAVKGELAARINFDTEATTMTIREQMRVPVALRHIFPIGVTGLFCALMLFLMLSTDTTYLHSWGSIFVQDVVLPLRKKPVSQKIHLLLLRLSILGVAAFAWIFSYYFGQVSYILMFFAITATVYSGGAGSVIIGGLYWKRGTTAGAWAAMSCSVIGGIISFALSKLWPEMIYPFLNQNYPTELADCSRALEYVGSVVPIVNWKVTALRFPISGQEMYLLTIIVSIFAYITVSLLTCKKEFNLDKMLHRGKYNLEHVVADNGEARREEELKKRKVFNWRALFGITPEYTRGDRILAYSIVIWTFYNFGVFLFLVVFNFCFYRWSNEAWFLWWKYYTVGQGLVVGAITVVWFTWGATRDLFRLFRNLKSLNRDVDSRDDGRVS